jgi:hypothetical protein
MKRFQEDETWIIQYRKHKILDYFFRCWKALSSLLNPVPFTKGIAVYAAFKWISLSFKNISLQANEPRYHFPYHLTIESDGNISTYLLSRIRQYAVTNLNVSAKSLPLFVHATALLDAFQLMKTFLEWKSIHTNVKKFRLRMFAEIQRKYFKRWLTKFLFDRQSRNSYVILSLQKNNKTLYRYFLIWNRTFRLKRYYERTYVPSIQRRVFKKWKHEKQYSILCRTAKMIAANFLRLGLLRKSFSLWEKRLISLQNPILLLNSQLFKRSVLLYLKTKYFSAPNQFHFSHGLVDLVNSAKSQHIDSTTFQRIVSMARSNFSSSRAQSFLFMTAETYYTMRSLLRSLMRLHIFNFSTRRVSDTKMKDLTAKSFYRNTRIFKSFQCWKFSSFRNLNLRKKSLLLRYQIAKNILHKLFGLWLVASARNQLFSRLSSIIVKRRWSKELYFAWFAWRNQYERSVLSKKCHRTILLLRDQEIEEFSSYMVRNSTYCSKQTVMRAWALYVRDRSKGKRLYSVWFKFSGKFSVFQYFWHWKIQFNLYIQNVINIQKVWRGYLCRILLFPKRVKYLRFFRTKADDIIAFRRVYLAKRLFSLLLNNLVAEKERQLKVLRHKLWGRFFRKIYQQWKGRRKISSKIYKFTVARNRRIKFQCIGKLVQNMKARRLIYNKNTLIQQNVLKQKFHFWKDSFVRFKILRKNVELNYEPNKLKLLGWTRWYDFFLRCRVQKRTNKVASLQKMEQIFRQFFAFAKRERNIRCLRRRNGLRFGFKSMFVHCLRNDSENRTLTVAANFQTLWLKRKSFRSFRHKIKSDIDRRQAQKPFLLLKYERHAKSRRLNSHQRSLVNFFSRKFLFGNIQLLSSLRKWSKAAIERSRRRIEYKKILLFFKMKRLKQGFYFLLVCARHQRNLPTSKFLSKAQNGIIPDAEMKALFYKFGKRNKHIRKFSCERAVKMRVRFSRAKAVAFYHFFHKLRIHSWHLDKSKSEFLIFEMENNRKRAIKAFYKWNIVCGLALYYRRLLSEYRNCKNHMKATLVFTVLRRKLKIKRRIRHLFKVYFQQNDIFKLNLYLQKWKKYFFLKQKKVFTVVKQQSPVSQPLSMFSTNTYNDLLDESAFQYPDIKSNPKYQINLVHLISNEKQNEKLKDKEPLERVKANPPSLFYYQKEVQACKFRFIAKLQRKARLFFALLRDYKERKKRFRKTKWKPLKERMKFYMFLQFRKFRSHTQKKHLYQQICLTLQRNHFKKQKLEFFHYWRKVGVLRSKFFQIQKRFFLFPLFNKWLLVTIDLLRHRRLLSHFSARRFMRIKSLVFNSWKITTENAKMNAINFHAVQQRYILASKRRAFYEWIFLLDQKRISENFHKIQRKRSFFALRNAFHIWQKALCESELITWKNLQIGFQNWKLLVASKHQQKSRENQAAVFDYCRKGRLFFQILGSNYYARKSLQRKSSKLQRKNFLKKLLSFFRIWKGKMYWKMRNLLKLSTVDKLVSKESRTGVVSLRRMGLVSLCIMFRRWLR